MANEGLFYKLLLWREKRIKEKHFTLIISFIMGVRTAAAAIILKQLIRFIQHVLTGNFSTDSVNYLYLLYPVIGILLVGLFVKYIVRDDIGRGMTKILYAISQRKSRVKPYNTWTSIVASSVTIGFGESVGVEAPVVLIGAAIGSNLGRVSRMEQKTLMLLVGCGATGAIADIFEMPIVRLVFVTKVLILDPTVTSVLPLLISSMTATTMFYIFTGTGAMFKFSQTETFEIERIPCVLLLSVFCGLISPYFTRVMDKVEGVYRKLGTYWRKFMLGGVMLSILIFLLPPLYGEGYNTINSLLNGQFLYIMDKSLFHDLNDTYFGVLIFLTLILPTKVLASSATNAGGGCGGIFAPSLYLGCIIGFIFAHTSNYFPFTIYISEKNFTLLDMADIMSGVTHVPLIGVFLTVELTDGHNLSLPLMIISISSYVTILIFEPHSICSMRLAQKGELLAHYEDRAVLTLLRADSVIEKDFQMVSPKMMLDDMVKVISRSGRNAFPVVGERDVLLGIVLLDNIRSIMFRPELYNRFHVSKFTVSTPTKIVVNTPMDQIIQMFNGTRAWNLPVVDENGHYVGFVSKSKIFNSCREVLVDNLSGN